MQNKEKIRHKTIGFFVIAILIFNTSHYFFDSDNNKVLRWFLFDLGNAILPCFLSICLFFLTPYKYHIEKGIWFFVMLDTIFELIDLLINNNKNNYYFLFIQNGLIILGCIKLITACRVFDIATNHKIESTGIYLVSTKPNTFLKFLGALFGGGGGGMKILVVSDSYYALFWITKNERKKIKIIKKDGFSKLIGEAFVVKLKIKDVDGFYERCNYLCENKKTVKFNFIFNNCVTCWKDVFKIFDIKIDYMKLEFIPSVFMLKNYER